MENQRLEPKNHPIEKENLLPSTSMFWGFHINFPGCMLVPSKVPGAMLLNVLTSSPRFLVARSRSLEMELL